MAEAPGSYFLTDYLTRSFDTLVIKGMGLDRYPELRDMYFENYSRVVYLAQQAADKLGLPLEIRQVGYCALESRLVAMMEEAY